MLNETFGVSGTAQDFFGGEWWLVGLLLLLFFISFLTAYKVSSDAIGIFMIIALLSMTYYSLFIVEQMIPQTILLIIFMYIGSAVYLWFRK